MKRIISILLAFMMAFSVANISFAEEAVEDVTEAVQDIRAEKLTPEERYAEDVRRDEIIRRYAAEKQEEEDNDSSELMATYTVKGTITLPDGVKTKSGDSLYIELISAAAIEEGMIVEEYGINGSYGTLLEPANNKNSFSYSVSTTAKGEYILAVKYYTGRAEIMGDWLYYTADGLVRNPYIADVINVTSSTKSGINMTMPEAETSVSGTLDLSDLSITKDGNIFLYFTNMDFVGAEHDFYCCVPVSKGDKSADFEIGLPLGNYYMAISSSYTKYSYYTSSGATNNWSYKEIFYVGEDGKVLDMAPIAKSTSTSSEGVEFTIKFKDAADGYTEYYIETVDEYGEYIAGRWVGLNDGAKTVTVTLDATSEDESEVYLRVKPIYNPDSTGWSEDDRNILYYSSGVGKGGFVGSIAHATDISGKTSVTVTEQAYVTIKGDYSIEGDAPVNRYMFIGAEFETESFCTYVPIGNGSYAIKVPKRLAGEKFELFTAEAQYNATNNVTLLGDTYTLKSTAATTAGDVFLGEYVTVSGNINIPFEASENGAVVAVHYGYEYYDGNSYNYVDINDAARCVIMPGETSVKYEMSVPADVEELNIYADLTMYESAEITENSDAWISLEDGLEVDINFMQTAVISGTIYLPAGMTFDEPVSLEVVAQQDINYNYTYATIPAGETSVDYSIKVAKGDKLRLFSVCVEDNSALVSESYYDGNGFTTERTRLDWVITGDIIASGTLTKAAGIAVNVTVPKSASFTGKARMRAYAESDDTTYSSERVEFTESGTYPLWIVVPEDAQKEYTISINVYDTDTYEGNLLLGTYYYTDTGWVTDYDADNKIYMTTEDEGASFTVPTKVTANVKIDFPAGAYADGFYADICLVDKDGNQISRNTFEYDLFEDKTVEIGFPDTLTGSVYVEYYISAYGESNILCDKTYYYSALGPVETIEDATAVGVNILKNKGVTITVEKQKEMRGKVVVDGTYKYVTPLEEFNVILESVDGSSRRYFNARVDEDLNYTVSFDSYVPAGEYYVTYALYSYNVEGTNLLTMEETQLLDSNGNRVKISVTEDTDDIDVEFTAGYALSGTVKLPDDAYISGSAEVQLRIKGYSNEYYTEVRGINEENSSVEYMMGIATEDEGEYVLEVTVWADREDENGGYSNLVYDRSYYRASDTECSMMMEDCEEIEIDGNTTGVDVTLMTGVGIDVKVSMPASVPDACSVNLYLYNSRGWLVEEEYVYFGDWMGGRTNSFSIVVPKDESGETVYLAYEVDSIIDSLCHSEILYVSADGTITYTNEEATAFVLGEDNGVVEFTVALAEDMDCVIESEHPYQSGDVYLYDYTHPEEADYLNVYFSSATSFYYSHSLRFQSGENRDIMTYYNGYDNVISVPGDSFDLVFDAQAYSYYSNYGFKIVKIEGMMYEAESEHPYTESDLPIEYEYTHPDKDVDALEIYLSGETYIGEGAVMYIYNSDDVVEFTLEGTSYEKVIEVEGNSFRAVIERQSYETFEDDAFGFAFEKIEPVYKHTVTFKDYDGTVLETVQVRDGEGAWYDDVDNLKRESEDENYVYIFNGWDKEEELEYITKDVTVTAEYEKVRAYKITFKNIDGTVLYEQRLPKHYGIFYDGEAPVYPYETDINYSFVGWDKEMGVAEEDTVFTAVFKKVYIESEHDYLPYSDVRYEYTEAGATSMKITFSETTRTENSYDTISIYYKVGEEENLIGTYSGYGLAGKTIDIPSDTVVIHLQSDGSVQYYGFAVTDIEAVFDTADAKTDTHVTVYEGNETVVNVSMNKYIGGTVMVAAYDVDGNLMWAKEAVIDTATLDATVVLIEGAVPDIVKTMVWNGLDDMSPVIEAEITTADEIEVIGGTGSGGSATGGVTAG